MDYVTDGCWKCRDNGFYYAVGGARVCAVGGCEAGRKMRDGIKAGLEDREEGRTIPWKDLRRSVGQSERSD